MIKNNYVAVFALFITIAFVMISGCTGTDDAINTVPSGNNVPNTSGDTTSSSVLPKDPNVFDKAYAQRLLDQRMYTVRNSPESFEPIADHIAMQINSSTNKKDITWAPEKVILAKNKGFEGDNLISFGLDGKINEFYSGPVVVWFKKDPDSVVIYHDTFVAMTGGEFYSYGEVPYKYGVEKYEDPPPEVLKVFSDKGVTLHY